MTSQRPYSIGRQLSVRLLLLTLTVLGLLCAGVYAATAALYERSQQRILALKINKLSETSQNLLRAGDDRFLNLLRGNAQRRPGTRLELFNADGSVFYRDPLEDPHLLSAHSRSRTFELGYLGASGRLSGSFAIDVQQDVRILRSLAVFLLVATLVGGIIAGALGAAAVRHGLKPLRLITRQTEQISSGRLSDRLALTQPVSELQPWVEQFNSLMDRMETSYMQLEAFNADVAHELRTPLTSLIGKTEIALTRQRSVLELSDTLESNLEELHRVAALVNDMLFLSRADRGARARLGVPLSLRSVVTQVLDFHEAAAAEHGLKLGVAGDLQLPVDEPLFKRALSNLLSNATRYALPHSTIRVVLDEHQGSSRVMVENEGTGVPPEHLPRLFDRFYRADPSRSDSEAHHGLGLAIVAAIARMHGGHVFASAQAGITCVGFTVAQPDSKAAGPLREAVDHPSPVSPGDSGREPLAAFRSQS